MKKILFILCICALPSFADASTLGRPANSLGLVGYWSFNEGTSTIAGDSSGNNNFGTTSNMANPATATSGWGPGKLGGGLNFDGVNDVVTVLNSTSLQIESGNATWSAWIYPTNAGDAVDFREVIFDKENAGGGGIHMSVSNNQLCMFGSGKSCATGTILNNQWYHVVLVKNGTTATFYVNGGQNNSRTWTGSAQNVTLGLGNDAQGGRNWTGRLDEMRLYNRALSATEVQSLYNSGAVKFGNSQTLTQGSTLAQGLVGHWTLDGQDVQNTIADRSGQNNAGYFVGGATSTAKVRGLLGQGLQFDGSQAVSIAKSLGAAGAISFWAKPSLSQPGGGGFPTFVGGNVTSQIEFGFQTSGASMYYKSGSFFSTTYAADNTWHLFTLSSDGTNAQLYIDGVFKEQVTYNFSAVSKIFLGSSSGSLFYSGVLDDFRVYNRALTAAEVKQLYQLGGQIVNASSKTLTQDTPLSSGLVGHWTFDGADFQNSVVDKSGKGNTGYFVGGATSSAKVRGQMGQALNFDGVNDYVDAGAGSSLNLTNDLTVSAWINLRSFGEASFGRIISNRDSGGIGSGGYELHVSNSGISKAFTFIANNTTYNSNPNVIDTNQWYHVVAVRSGTTVTFYSNGVSAGSVSVPTVNSSTANLFMGKRGDNNRWFDGVIDDPHIYNRALSAAEVLQLYRLGK